MARTRRILAVDPTDRDAVEAGLGALLGKGWGPGCLTGYPQPPSPADPMPPATLYLCDAHLTDDEATKIESLAAEDAGRTVGKALAVGDAADAVVLTPGDDAASVPEDKQRVSLARLLAEHAAKSDAEPAKIEAEGAKEAAWIR